MARIHHSTLLSLGLAAALAGFAARSVRRTPTPPHAPTSAQPQAQPTPCSCAESRTPPPTVPAAPTCEPSPTAPVEDDAEDEAPEPINEGLFADECSTAQAAPVARIVASASSNRAAALRALARRPLVIAHLWSALLALDEGDADAYEAALARISPEVDAVTDASVAVKRARLLRAIRDWLDHHDEVLTSRLGAQLAPCWMFDRYGMAALDAFGVQYGGNRDLSAARLRNSCVLTTLERSMSRGDARSVMRSYVALSHAVFDVAPAPVGNGSIWVAHDLNMSRALTNALWVPENLAEHGAVDDVETALDAATRRSGDPEAPLAARAQMPAFWQLQEEHLPVFSRAICARARTRRVPLLAWQCEERARAASNAALAGWLRAFTGE